MGAVLNYDDEGNTLSFAPAVLGRQKPDDPENDSGNYRFYPDEPEQEENSATGFLWEPYTTLRTQTSRQYGRGI